MNRLKKHFVSEMDKKLREFDKNHSPTPSQRFEMEKYKKIYELRDHEHLESIHRRTSQDEEWL